MSNSKVWVSNVKWFDETKGFGFIRHPEKNADVFVHYSEIQTDGFRTLTEGQTVHFRMTETPKGYLAQDVEPQ